MKQNIKLIVSLKNADLHALTAEKTIKEILNYSKLVSLKRYIIWDIDLEANSESEAKEKIEKILKSTYYLINPNKEAYTINKINKKKVEPPKQLQSIIIENPNFQKPDLINKIAQKTKVKIDRLEKLLMWEFVLDVPNNNQLNLQKELAEEIIISSSLEKGLLVNELFEKFRFVNLEEYYDFA